MIQLEIASVYTTIAGVYDIGGPDATVKTFEAPALDDDDVGIPKLPTGRVDGGNAPFELWFDPTAATLQAMTDLIAAPPDTPPSWKQIWSDAAATAWPFDGTLEKCTPKAAQNDGLKASANIVLNGIPTYPT